MATWGKPVVLAFILLLTLLTTFSVSAHKYLETESSRTREEPVLVSDHQVSWAAYEELAREDQVDYYMGRRVQLVAFQGTV